MASGAAGLQAGGKPCVQGAGSGKTPRRVSPGLSGGRALFPPAPAADNSFGPLRMGVSPMGRSTGSCLLVQSERLAACGYLNEFKYNILKIQVLSHRSHIPSAQQPQVANDAPIGPCGHKAWSSSQKVLPDSAHLEVLLTSPSFQLQNEGPGRS